VSAVDCVQWRLIEQLLEDRFGWGFDDVRRPILAGRLEQRVASLGLYDATDYYHYLRFHPDREEESAEIKKLVTNNETYFFRADYQLSALTQGIVPALAKTLERPLRVLSAGCSSGEEAYSLGIVLQDVESLLPHGFEVDGFDLSPARIAQGRRAVYADSSLRACDEATRQRFFAPSADGHELRARYRKGVRLFEGNLVGTLPLLSQSYDVVFCRNVLIYLSDEGVTRAIQSLAQCLRPGGYLFLGHAESLLGRAGSFAPETCASAVLYRRGESP
jgi:chemotaxis protein methyltransferase CheR